MLHIGRDITSAGDRLEPIAEQKLVERLRAPEASLEAEVTQLRTVKLLDAKRYGTLKRRLPYVVCGTFTPPYRRTENFAYVESFFIDIDGLLVVGVDMAELRRRLVADDRVAMLFTSPGGDGLKVLMRLKERCYDAGEYSAFYKRFVSKWAAEHGIANVVDSCTNDVTRACFLSVDREAFFNEAAVAIDWRAVLADGTLPAVADDDAEAGDAADELLPVAAVEPATGGEPTDEVMARVLRQLELGRKRAAAEPLPAPYVPERLNEIMEQLIPMIAQTGLVVDSVTDINYGKKLRASSGLHQAELNVFCGKRGFSVVASPRRGTSPKLNEMLCELVSQCITSLAG